VAFGDDVARRGWRTGSVLPGDVLPALATHLSRPGRDPAPIAGDDWLVVVSQTCDIVAGRLDAEPFVEVLHCHPHHGRPRTGFVNLRSTRRIDFRPNTQTHRDLVLTAHATADRYVVPREWFVEHGPEPRRCLSVDAGQWLLAWYALRASRPAWPDALVQRLGSARQRLLGALAPVSDDVAEVRVAIAERGAELDAGHAYHVAVFFVVDEDAWNADQAARSAIYDAFARFVSALAGCDGVEVDMERSDVVSGGEFTWQAMQATDKWNFANLTDRGP
jgi:hypothetical protein